MFAATARLVEAYRATEYRAGRVLIHVGEASPSADREMARHGVRTAVFVTACNPLGHAMARGRNVMLMRRLRARLLAEGVAFVNGEGRGLDKTWPAEASVLVFGLGERRAASLGRAWRQNAVVAVRYGKRAELVALR